MDTRLSDYYFARATSLGSGPRERATTCSCHHRASPLIQENTCYTSLKPDPPIISYEKQRYTKSYNGSIAPLIQVLNREPTQWCNEKKQRRASSARQSSQSDRSQVRQLRIENFISVRGKTIPCHERPHQRASDSFLHDHIIKSVQDATVEHLHELSIDEFGVEAFRHPIAPCPSPEPSEESCEDEGWKFRYNTSNEMAPETVFISPNNSPDLKNMVESNGFKIDSIGDNEEYVARYNYKAETACIEEIIDVGEKSSKDTNSNRANFEFLGKDGNISGKVNVPTETDRVIKTSTFVSQKKGNQSRTPVRRSSVIYQKRDSLIGTDAKTQAETKIPRRKERCSSASPVLGYVVKSKHLQLLSDEDMYRAKLHVSKGAFETLQCNDLLREKGKFSRDKSNSDEMTTKESEVSNSNAIASKEEAKADTARNIQVTSKPPSLPKKDISFSNMQAVATNSSKSAKSVSFAIAATENGCTEDKRSNRRRIRKTEKSTTKVLRRAGKELCRRKILKEKEPRIIWREISGIDEQKNATPVDGAVNTQQEATRCEINDATSAPVYLQIQEDDKKANDEINVTDSTKTKDQPATDVKSCVINKSITDLNDEEIQQAYSDKNGRTTRSVESDDKRKITRPTSAVIQRYIEDTKQKKTKSSDKKASNLTKRPMSSNPVAVNGRKRLHTKTRPVSANVLKFSYPASSSVKSKVVSSQSLQMKPTNKRISLVDRQALSRERPKSSNPDKLRKESATFTPSQRPKSAPNKTTKNTVPVAALDVDQEKQKISEECMQILDVCKSKGIKMSLDTLKRALMPPSELAKPYSQHNLPHSSRLLNTKFAWAEGK